MKRISFVSILAASLGLTLNLHATITVLDVWHMGESDVGAVNGGYATNTLDSAGGLILTNQPAGGVYPTYTTNVSPAAANATGSRLSEFYPGGPYAQGNVIAGLTNNFGVELWVYPTANTGGRVLVYNGNTGRNGWGLYQSGTNCQIFFGGVGFSAKVPIATNAWTCLALVCSNRLSTLYTNGVSSGVTLASYPNVPVVATNTSFLVAADNTGAEAFAGLIDEVHVFTFASGAFSTNDLLINQSLVVTTNADSGRGSLRYAVWDANPGSTIIFTNSLSGQTIGLINGEMLLNSDLTIDASALADGVQIDGELLDRIFEITNGASVTLNSLALTDGSLDFSGNGAVSGGGILVNSGARLTVSNCAFQGDDVGHSGYGGAIYNVGTVIASQCTFTLCGGFDAVHGGSALYNGGTATVSQCTFYSNLSDDLSGESAGSTVYNDTGGTFTLDDCTIYDNQSGTGFYNNGLATLDDCTISGNEYAANGGGVCNSGLASLNNCAISGNNALQGYGGGVYNSGLATFVNCTIYSNSAFYGGGIASSSGTNILNNCTIRANSAVGSGGGIFSANSGVFIITNTIVAGNTNFGSGDVSGSYSGVNNFVGGDPQLLPAGNYGGPTPTMPPLAGSPVIDAGTDEVTNFLATDQRGYPRLSGEHVDIGAVEFRVGPLVLNATDAGEFSLRGNALYNPPGSTISFTNTLSGQTIALTRGEILLANNLSIDAGSLPAGITISNAGGSRIFEIASGAAVALNRLTLLDGAAPAGVYPADSGGAILNRGSLTLTNCYLASNTAINSGGAGGGAIENDQGTLTLNDCTLAANTASLTGGAIESFQGALTLNQCTVAANQALDRFGGGGLTCDSGSLTLNQSTVSGNSAAVGGGIVCGGSVAIFNSIVAGNIASTDPDLSGAFSVTGVNLTSGNPSLVRLGFYGGLTPTMPPLPGSPVIDAGDDSVLAQFATDQRGYPRLSGAHVDIGAVEAQIAPAGLRPVLMKPSYSVTGGGRAFQFTFTNAANIDFAALTATNVALPPANWTLLGNIPQISPGRYQFTDPGATNSPQRFYRAVSP